MSLLVSRGLKSGEDWSVTLAIGVKPMFGDQTRATLGFLWDDGVLVPEVVELPELPVVVELPELLVVMALPVEVESGDCLLITRLRKLADEEEVELVEEKLCCCCWCCYCWRFDREGLCKFDPRFLDSVGR